MGHIVRSYVLEGLYKATDFHDPNQYNLVKELASKVSRNLGRICINISETHFNVWFQDEIVYNEKGLLTIYSLDCGVMCYQILFIKEYKNYHNVTNGKYN